MMAQIIWSARRLVKVLLGIQQKFYQTSSRAIFLFFCYQMSSRYLLLLKDAQQVAIFLLLDVYTMSIFQMRSNASLPLRSARYELGLIGSLFLAKGSFFYRPKAFKVCQTSWSELFSLVWNGGTKYHQLCLFAISCCHSLPIFDTFH